jgi:hypothetical protein
MTDYRRATAFILVVVGRPIIYGLALGGEEDVEEVLRELLADTEITLGLSGYGASMRSRVKGKLC